MLVQTNFFQNFNEIRKYVLCICLLDMIDQSVQPQKSFRSLKNKNISKTSTLSSLKSKKKSSVVLYAAFVFQVSSSKKTPQKFFLRQYETFKSFFVSNCRLISNQIDSKIVFFIVFRSYLFLTI